MPFISGTNPRCRADFSRTASTSDLKVNLGRWEPTPQRPHPRWDALQDATVWSSHRHRDLVLLRRSLAAAPPQREALQLGEDMVMAETLEHEGLRHQCMLFPARFQGKRLPTPAAVTQLTPKAFILQCEAPTAPVAPYIGELLQAKVPGLLWGHHTSRIRAMVEQLAEDTDSRYHTIRVVCHGALPTGPGPLLYPETMVALVGPPSLIPEKL